LEVQLKTKAADVAVMIENLEIEKAKVNDIKEVHISLIFPF
jgi:hypothetical protein